DEVRRERPSVGDEVKNGLWYLEEILWDCLPDLSAALSRGFERAYGEELDLPAPPLRLPSWVGGGRDGNPNVTARAVAAAVALYRECGVANLLKQAQALGAALSIWARYVEAPAVLRASLERDAARMPELAARERLRTEGEPWRRKLGFIEARLAAALRS